MKYLEELRRRIENKDAIEAARSANDLAERRKAFRMARQGATARIRAGNFVYHRGKLGFYDDVRAVPVDWVQFEDSDGVPYYYDPLTKKTTYELPTDSDYHHHSVDDRIAYDAEHGEGAYDRMMLDRAMVESVNAYGGYYDAEENWIPVNGFYDENDYFWDLDKGWFNELGEYILYPVITGTLDFMV